MSAATSPELHDRRQRAREAGLDATAGLMSASLTTGIALDEAIETATRVRIDDAVYEAFAQGTRYSTFRNGLIEAFKAAGFEVEE
jgi:hypothetical protein